MSSRLDLRLTFKQKHGESQYNLDGRIGGDTLLSSRGEAYARKLPELVRKSVGVRNFILSQIPTSLTLTCPRRTIDH
jgi:hypothetical protein